MLCFLLLCLNISAFFFLFLSVPLPFWVLFQRQEQEQEQEQESCSFPCLLICSFMAILLRRRLCFAVLPPIWFSLLMQSFNSSLILILPISLIPPLMFLTHSPRNSIPIPIPIPISIQIPILWISSYRCRAYPSLMETISLSSPILLLLPQMGFKISPISISIQTPSINLSVSTQLKMPPPTNPSCTEASVKSQASSAANPASNPFSWTLQISPISPSPAQNLTFSPRKSDEFSAPATYRYALFFLLRLRNPFFNTLFVMESPSRIPAGGGRRMEAR